MIDRLGPANPLFYPLIGVLITMIQAMRRMMVAPLSDFFDVWSIGVGIVLLALYLRRSRRAGAFMFWSLVPIYPVHLAATWLGWYGTRSRPIVYGVLLLLWLVLTIFAWRWKRQYEDFIRAPEREAGVAG